MTEETAPEYRIRLFLSVDLVGSTAYKSKAGRTNLKWIKAFQKFYGEFPSQLSKNYTQLCAETPEIGRGEKEDCPKVWKTIGDEILFVNRVTSITQLSAYVRAFSKTLIEFGKEVQAGFDLNTKGNAWIAAFPTPNRSIRLSMNGSDPLIGEHDVLTEEVEAAVDRQPSDYDFLGKGIDGGFRISRNSTVDTFTVSPALAFLLCKASRNVDTTKFDGHFIFHEPQEFKGLVNERKYPVISIITSRDQKFDALEDMEAKLLDRPRQTDFNKLFDYLDAYIDYHEIEKPALKLTERSADILQPDNYLKYIEEWQEDLKNIKAAKLLEESAAAAEDGQPSESSESTPAALSVNDLKNAVQAFLRITIEHSNRIKEKNAERCDNDSDPEK